MTANVTHVVVPQKQFRTHYFIEIGVILNFFPEITADCIRRLAQHRHEHAVDIDQPKKVSLHGLGTDQRCPES